MDNKVGDNVPSEKVLAGLLEQLAHVVAKLSEFGIHLDTDDRKRLFHERLGAEPHIRTVYTLATRHGVTLKGIPLEGMMNDRKLKAAMEPFVAAFQAAKTLAEDTAGQAESESWEAFLAYYGVLSSMADRDPALATELAAVVAFMANGPRKTPKTQ